MVAGGTITSNLEWAKMTELLISGLHHDLSKKRSFVHFVWKNDPENLGLDVPFQCTPEDLPEEARKALKALSDELGSVTVATPP
jgi:hypothetical protein